MRLISYIELVCAFTIVNLNVLRTDLTKNYITNDKLLTRCTSGDQNGRQRCFYLGVAEQSWRDANSSCWNPQSDGRLAIDDSPESHELIRHVVRDANITDAWIGGFTSPQYWHWMATPEKSISVPVYFQGCYHIDNFHEVTSTNVSSAEEVCRRECLLADPHTRFFGLQGIGRLKIFERVSCYCGRNLIESNTNPSECIQCQSELRNTSCSNVLCGMSESYIAVYSINTTRKCNDWWEGHPELPNRRCLLYNMFAGDMQLYLSWNCQLNWLVYCYKTRESQNPALTDDCTPGKLDHLNRCYSSIGVRTDFATATVTCERYNQSVIRLDSEEDIRDIPDNHPRIFWIGGTNLRWVWYREEPEEIRPVNTYWRPREAYPFENVCMLVKENSDSNIYWQAGSCSQPHYYVCQQERYTQGPHTTSAAVSGTTEDQKTTPSHVTHPRTEGPTTPLNRTKPQTKGTTTTSHATELRTEGTSTIPETRSTERYSQSPQTASAAVSGTTKGQETTPSQTNEPRTEGTTTPIHGTEPQTEGTSTMIPAMQSTDVVTTGKRMQTLTPTHRETTQKFSTEAVQTTKSKETTAPVISMTSGANTPPKETTPGVTVGKTRSEVTHSTTTVTPSPSSAAPQTTTQTPVVKPPTQYNPPQLTVAIVVVTIFALLLIPSLVSLWINRQRRK